MHQSGIEETIITEKLAKMYEKQQKKMIIVSVDGVEVKFSHDLSSDSKFRSLFCFKVSLQKRHSNTEVNI